MDKDSINVLSLCAGGGGLDLGLKLACPTARVVCCVEHEAYCCEVLATRMEEKALDDAPIWTDLRTFDGRPWRGIVDCIMGGIPCQGSSLAGLRKLSDDPRDLWPDTRRIIREVGARLIFLENVPGWLIPGGDEPAPIARILGELSEDGFDAEWLTLPAGWVGARLIRERTFILATPREVVKPDSPSAGHIARYQRTQGRWCGNNSARSRLDGGAWAREPELARVAYGIPNRVDRLRMLGNGVVPLQAAYAFCSLAARLFEGGGK